MNKTFYITTPIYYPSDKLHIGHSYTTVAADAMARYKRMQGYDVMFLTGTDEHGQKIEDKARDKGVTPKQFVDEIVVSIKELWKLLDISYDRFIRTTDPYHEEAVQKIFKRLYEQGDIYKGVYKGKYCKPCESFWTESQLKDGKCPDCGREVEEAEEEAYFLKLSNYADRLVQYYQEHPAFMEPQARLNEMINNFIKPGLEDLCVSRTSFTWGIPVDFDPGHVVYVWVDALTNYITALGYENGQYQDFEKYWPADVHLVGKEIMRFHTIIWPIMLMALGLPLPKKVFGHGWLLLDGGKMSKSKGNVVDPVILCEKYSVDAIRYFLLREIPFGSDGQFSNEALIGRINSDLANDLGNLVSRTVSMIEKYFGGTLPVEREAAPLDEELRQMVLALKPAVEQNLDNFQFPVALTEIFRVISRTNKYIDETQPWVLGKAEETKGRLAAVLANLTESIRVCAILLTPFLPSTSPRIFAQLGLGEEELVWERAGLYDAGCAVSVHKGDALFPRIDVAKELAALEAEFAPKAEAAPRAEAAPKKEEKSAPVQAKKEVKEELPQGIITIDDFNRVELTVCKVLACERVAKSDKLLKFRLDDGGEGRQVLSGIAAWYEPETLVGKNVACVTNLKPVKLRGELSQGMLLSAEASPEKVVLLTLDEGIPAGAKIK